MGGQQSLHDGGELRVEQVAGRDVHRHGEPLAVRAPARALRKRLIEDEAGQGAHQPGVLGQRDELERGDEAEAGVDPADQGLDRVDHPVDQVDLWLVVELELTLFDGVSQLLDQLHPVGRSVEVLLVDGKALALHLGPVHGEVGAADQIGRIGGILGHDGDPDAGSDLDAHGVEHEALLDTGRQAHGHGRGVIGVGVEQGHGELVATEADNQIGLAQ